MTYIVLIQGGLGPDHWEKEITIRAVDFRDAANQAIALAEEGSGYVILVEQGD